MSDPARIAPFDRSFGYYPPGDRSRTASGVTTLRALVEHVRTDDDLAELTRIYRQGIVDAKNVLEASYAKMSKRSELACVSVSLEPYRGAFGKFLPREHAGIPTGLYGFDVDGLFPGTENVTACSIEFRDEVAALPWCAAAWVTASKD